mgnify:FL=1
MPVLPGRVLGLGVSYVRVVRVLRQGFANAEQKRQATMSDVGVWEEYRVKEAYSNGQKDGVLTERKVIVKWLRARKHPYDHQIADAIERCAHLAGDDE